MSSDNGSPSSTVRLDLKIKHKGQILVAVPLLFSLVFLALLTALLRQSEYRTWQEMHSKTVVYESGSLMRLFHDAGIAMGGYALTKSPLFRERFDAVVAEIPREFKKMKKLVGDNRSQKESLDRLEAATTQGLELLTRARDSIEEGGGVKKVRDLFGDMKRVTKSIGLEIERLTEESRRIETRGPSARRSSDQLLRAFVIVGVVLNIMLTFLLAYFFTRGITNRLAVLTENTRRLARGESLADELSGSDEIANLDSVFHSMARALDEARRKERAIVENMLVSLIAFDSSGTIQLINPQSVECFGYAGEDLIGRNIGILFGDGSTGARVVDDLLSRSLGHIAQLEMVRSNGERFPVELSTTEFTAEGMQWYMANILDVSEREELERLKREFVSIASHELRTPLTSIHNSLAILNSATAGELSPYARKMVDISERNVTRLINLINDILDVDKLQSGKMEMIFDDAELGLTVERAVESVTGLADQQKVQLVVQPTTSIIYADEDRIVQVLVNLLSNAIKYSSAESRVEVTAEEVGGFTHVRVRDYGRGIPEKYKQLVFEKFQQVDSGDAKQKGGTGLGLPICKAIIEQHGGEIGVESTEGQGSTFWFKLPASTSHRIVKQVETVST